MSRFKTLLTVLVLLALPLISMISGAQGGSFDIDTFDDEAVDRDRDGLFEYLELWGEVRVDLAGKYTIRASISPYGADSKDPMVIERRLDLEQGRSTIHLQFPSYFFWEIEHDGAFDVHLQMFDAKEHFMTSADHRTGEYDYKAFERPKPMIELLEHTAEDRAVDLDGNGLNDLLVVSIQAISWGRGPVWAFAELLGKQVCSHIEVHEQEVQLDFVFNGSLLVERKVNGTIDVDLGVGCYDDAKVVIDHRTGEYDHTEFEAAHKLARFDGTPVVNAFDKDRNGKYDGLKMSVNVNVSFGWEYVVLANLMAQGMKMPIQVSISKTMDVGRHKVDLSIPGEEIQRAGVDGPYHISFTLMTSFDKQPLDHRKVRTDPYLADDFEGAVKPLSFLRKGVDRGMDKDGDDLYDTLDVSAWLDVTGAGKYRVVAHLGQRGFWFSHFFQTLDLKEGEIEVWFKFKGEEIYRQGSDGTYDVDVLIVPAGEDEKEPEPAPSSKSLHFVMETSEYRYRSFEHEAGPGDDGGPVIIDDETKRTATTEVMRVEISKTRPSLTITYADEKARPVEFHLDYERIIIFDDMDSDGRYDDGEGTYEAKLASDEWDHGVIRRQDLQNGGGKAIFTMSNLLDLHPLGSDGNEDYLDDWAMVSFTFTISSETMEITGLYNLSLEGESELKIDIGLQVRQRVDGDGLILEHHLYDKGHKYKFRTHESDGDHTWNGNGHASDEVFDNKMGQEQMVSFVSGGDKEHAFYSWVPYVTVTEDGAGTREEEVKVFFTTEALGMRLLIQYPFSRDVSSLVHDPSIGVDADNIPKEHITITTDFNPSTFILALVIAVVIVIVVWRRTGSDEEEY